MVVRTVVVAHLESADTGELEVAPTGCGLGEAHRTARLAYYLMVSRSEQGVLDSVGDVEVAPVPRGSLAAIFLSVVAVMYELNYPTRKGERLGPVTLRQHLTRHLR